MVSAGSWDGESHGISMAECSRLVLWESSHDESLSLLLVSVSVCTTCTNRRGNIYPAQDVVHLSRIKCSLPLLRAVCTVLVLGDALLPQPFPCISLSGSYMPTCCHPVAIAQVVEH